MEAERYSQDVHVEMCRDDLATAFDWRSDREARDDAVIETRGKLQ